MFSLRVDDEVEIRLLEERHADEVYALVDANREHLRPWLPWVDGTRSADDTRAFIRTALEGFAAGREHAAALRFRGELAGGIGLDVNAQMRHGEIGLNRVQILCAAHNVRSCAVPERLGFRMEGTLREFERVGERFHDIRVYAMLAAEWPGQVEREAAGKVEGKAEA